MNAIIAYLSLRALRIITIVSLLFVLVLALLVRALAYYLHTGWWGLMIPVVIIFALIIISRIIVMRRIHQIHRHPFTEPQRVALESFTTKIAELEEFEYTPFPTYAFSTLRDIMRHKDAKTLRNALEEYPDLADDLKVLDKHFGER